MRDEHPKEVEDFTKPFLVMFGLLLFMALFAIWAAFGYLVSLLSGLGVNALIDRLPRRS